MSDPTEAEGYYRAIEEEFNRRRGAPMLLSPRDWALIGEWREGGIPLRIVLQGIANAFESFERRGPTARRINSLSYCRQEVMALNELYLGLHGAGRPDGAPQAKAEERVRVVSRHLGRLVRRVRQAMIHASEDQLDPLVAVLARVVAELKGIRKDVKGGPFDPQAIEHALQRLDETVLEGAQRALPLEELRLLEREAQEALRDHQDRMSSDAFETTRRAVLSRLIRRRCRLPRMTLFD